MNEREGLLADLELEIQNSIEALKVPHLPYWHYLDGIGWLWTAPQFHPYVYSFERDNWLFYNQGSHNPWQYFDYQSQTWEDWYLE